MDNGTTKINYDNVIGFNRAKMVKKKGQKESFFFLLDEFQVSLSDKYGMTEHDTALIFMVASHQRFRDHDLTHSYIHYKGKRAKNKDLQEMLMLDSQQIKDFKKSMKKKELIKEDKYGMYINEDLTVRGKLQNEVKQYNAVFVDGVQSVYSILVKEDMDNKEKKQAIKDAGLVFSFLPFMNKKTNVLVDENFNNITMNELKSKLGLSRNHKLEERLGRINQAFKDATGKYLIYKLEPVGILEDRTNKKAFRLIINPRLVFSSNITDKNKLDAELFGDSETSNKSEVKEYMNCLELITEDETYYLPTNESYKVSDIRAITNEYNCLLFGNATISTNEILSIQFMNIETSHQEGIRLQTVKSESVNNRHKELLYI